MRPAASSPQSSAEEFGRSLQPMVLACPSMVSIWSVGRVLLIGGFYIFAFIIGALKLNGRSSFVSKRVVDESTGAVSWSQELKPWVVPVMSVGFAAIPAALVAWAAWVVVGYGYCALTNDRVSNLLSSVAAIGAGTPVAINAYRRAVRWRESQRSGRNA